MQIAFVVLDLDHFVLILSLRGRVGPIPGFARPSYVRIINVGLVKIFDENMGRDGCQGGV